MEGWWWVSFCVCVYVCACTGEWMRMWVSEWVKWSERKWSEVKRSEAKWSDVSECMSDWASESMMKWVKVIEWVWMSVTTVSHACHAKATSNAHCPTPATQKRRRPRDASGTPGRTSDPLAVHTVPRLPRKRGGDPWTPAEPRGVHPTPWQCTLSHACHAKEDASGILGRTSNTLAVHIVRRLPRKRGGDPGMPAEPLGVHPTPWQCTLSHACHAKEGRQRDASGTPGRTSDPLTVHIVPRLPRKRGGDPGTPARNPRAYIRPLGSAHCPTPATQKRRRPGRQRNPGAYIQPLGSAHCPTPATQKRRRPRDASGTPGRTSDPLDSAHCPMPATQKRRRPRDTSGTPGRTSDPLTVHIVPLSHACHDVCVCVSVCVCEWVSEWVCVSEWVSVCVCVCEWVRWGGGRAGEEEAAAAVAAADTELKTKTPHVNVGNNSNHLSVHQWIRSAIRGSQQLPPPPCAVLLVWTKHYNTTVNYMLVFDIVLKLLY